MTSIYSRSAYPQRPFPLTPSNAMAGRVAGVKRGQTGGVIQSHGREAPMTPAGLVNVQVMVLKEELQTRAMNAGSADPAGMYAPPTKNIDVASTHKGVLGMCVPAPGSTFRGGLGNDSNVRALFSTNGVSRKEKLAVPCVAQVSRDAGHVNSEDRSTVAVHGAQTIVNTGCQTIQPGQHLYVDPNPFTTIVDGQKVSAVNIPGTPRETCFFQIRPIDTNTYHSFARSLQDIVRVRVGRMPHVFRALQEGDAHKLFSEISSTCEAVFKEISVADDMPIRDCILLYAVDTFTQFAAIPGAIDNLATPADRQVAGLLGLGACLHALRVIGDRQSRIYCDFEATLPQNTSDVPRYNHDDDSVYSDRLTDLLDLHKLVATVDPAARLANINEARARIAIHMAAAKHMTSEAQHAYMRAFHCGISLSGAAKGKPLDMLMC